MLQLSIDAGPQWGNLAPQERGRDVFGCHK